MCRSRSRMPRVLGICPMAFISMGGRAKGLPRTCSAGNRRGGKFSILASPSAAALACVSWHAIERPALRWKDADLSGLRQRIGLAAVIAYSSAAIFFGIGFKLFGFGCLLPTALALTGGQILFWADKAGLTARLWFGSRNLAATAEQVGPSSASLVAPARGKTSMKNLRAWSRPEKREPRWLR